jgi:hypothetical protein
MKGFFVLVGALALVFTLAFALAEGGHPYPDQKYEIQLPVKNVPTTQGLKNFSEKTLIGGDNATNFIRLTAPFNFTTPFGNYTFPDDTEIDCDVPPGFPNPCDSSS